MFLYFTTFLGTIALSLLLTWHVRNIALARGWVSSPPSRRDVHTAPIPRFGGVSIYLSFAFMVGMLVGSSRYFEADVQFSASNALRILLPATLIFLAGLYDDIHSLGPYVKIAVQVLAGVLLFLGGLRVLQIPILFGDRTLGSALSLLLTVLWVLLITNAFNLIDGLDGLAAGSALFSTLTVLVVSLIHSNSEVSIVSLVLAGGIIGFLRFNFNPATIFLGDCGSLFIGFLLSALSLEGLQQKSSTVVAVAIPIVSFGLPILDTTISIVRRFLSGQPLFSADREHIHHKLLEIGFSHRGAVVCLYGVSALCGLLSLSLLHPGGKSLGIVLVVLGTGVWFGIQHLRYDEFDELKRMAHRTFQQRQIIVNNLTIRRSAEQLWKVEEFSEICRILEDTFVRTDFDGFELYINRWNPRLSESRNGKACWRHVWQRHAGQTAEPATDCGLTLSLNLLSGINQPSGSFSLYKAAGSSSLLIDINLLTSEFASALAGAGDRCLIRSKEQERVEIRANAAVAGMMS